MNNEQKRYPDQEKQQPKVPPEFAKEYRGVSTGDANVDEKRAKQDELRQPKQDEKFERAIKQQPSTGNQQ